MEKQFKTLIVEELEKAIMEKHNACLKNMEYNGCYHTDNEKYYDGKLAVLCELLEKKGYNQFDFIDKIYKKHDILYLRDGMEKLECCYRGKKKITYVTGVDYVFNNTISKKIYPTYNKHGRLVLKGKTQQGKDFEILYTKLVNKAFEDFMKNGEIKDVQFKYLNSEPDDYSTKAVYDVILNDNEKLEVWIY